MKKTFKNLLFVFTLLIISIYFSTNVYASPANNKTAFAIPNISIIAHVGGLTIGIVCSQILCRKFVLE